MLQPIDYAQYAVCDFYVYLKMVNVFDRLSVWVCQKHENCDFFLNIIDPVNIKLCTIIEVILFIPLSGPWRYFKVTAVWSSFNWKLYVFIRQSWNVIWLLTLSIRLWICNVISTNKARQKFHNLRPCSQRLDYKFHKQTSSTLKTYRS